MAKKQVKNIGIAAHVGANSVQEKLPHVGDKPVKEQLPIGIPIGTPIRAYAPEEEMQLGIHPATTGRINLAKTRIKNYEQEIQKLQNAIQTESQIMQEMMYHEIAREGLRVSPLTPKVEINETLNVITFKLPPLPIAAKDNK